MIAEYTEVETGKKADRPKLQEALAHARKAKATLVIAKLDRLGCNVHFISGLMESGVPFDCADRPGADPFRLHIEAAIAEEEARKISQRTREALRAAKRRGVDDAEPIADVDQLNAAGRLARQGPFAHHVHVKARIGRAESPRLPRFDGHIVLCGTIIRVLGQPSAITANIMAVRTAENDIETLNVPDLLFNILDRRHGWSP